MAGTKKIPQRQCIGCREMKNKKDLIRILKTDTEGIIIDVTGKKTAEVHIYVLMRIVLQRLWHQRDWNVPLKCR